MTRLVPEPVNNAARNSDDMTLAARREKERARAAKLRFRLMVWAIPVVLLVLLFAAKFISAGIAARQAVSRYHESNFEGVRSSASAQTFANFYETWKAHHNLGTANLQLRLLSEAEKEFTSGLKSADTDGKCHILPNLAIVYEQMGDEARSGSNEDEAKKRYQQAIDTVNKMPADKCPPPQSSSAKKTKQSSEEKQKSNPQQQQQSSDSKSQQDNSQDNKNIKDLREQLEQNNKERAKKGGGGTNDPEKGGGGGNKTKKPW